MTRIEAIRLKLSRTALGAWVIGNLPRIEAARQSFDGGETHLAVVAASNISGTRTGSGDH